MLPAYQRLQEVSQEEEQGGVGPYVLFNSFNLFIPFYSHKDLNVKEEEEPLQAARYEYKLLDYPLLISYHL